MTNQDARRRFPIPRAVRNTNKNSMRGQRSHEALLLGPAVENFTRERPTPRIPSLCMRELRVTLQKIQPLDRTRRIFSASSRPLLLMDLPLLLERALVHPTHHPTMNPAARVGPLHVLPRRYHQPRPLEPTSPCHRLVNFLKTLPQLLA